MSEVNNILLVAATEAEIQPVRLWLAEKGELLQDEGVLVYQISSTRIHLLVTGIGAVATTWAMQSCLFQVPFSLCINIGIAGALDPGIAPGTTVQIVSEQFGDIGLEEADGRFTPLHRSGLMNPDSFPFRNGLLLHPDAARYAFLPAARGITVQKVHGYEPTIEQFRLVFPDAQVESMEGAAFFFVCLNANIPFLALRGISNYVEKRNRDAWKLKEAIQSSNAVLIEMLEIICM